MKKRILLFLVSAICALCLSSCSDKNAESSLNNEATNATEATQQTTEEVIQIKEKMFVAQSNDIYLNKDNYLGKTIEYEGLYDTYNYAGKDFHSVIRYGPGCCGTDQFVGFEVEYDGEYPKQNDWVRVKGVLEEYTLENAIYLRLKVTEMEKLETRGLETVSQ